MPREIFETGTDVLSVSERPNFIKNASGYLSEYSDKASIHGVKYLGEKRRSILERIFWLLFLGISLYFCIALIARSYKKFHAFPDIVTIGKKATPIWKIPFPAITICPETKVKQRVYNFTDAYHKNLNDAEMTKEERDKLEHASLVCDSHLYPEGNKTIAYEAIEFLTSVAPDFNDVMWQCKWINQNQTCGDLLTPILTEEGICFTFNMLDREEMFTNDVHLTENNLQHGIKSTDWTLEKGYGNNQQFDTFPRRAVAAGQRSCFSVLMTLYEPDLDYICRGPVQGFKILLHNPTEVPRVSQHYLRAPLNQELVVSISPNLISTSEGLKDYLPENRQCFFSGERNLKFFQVYTQRNCEVECLANHTLKTCGCVSFFMPHDNSTKLCGAGSTICVHTAHVDLLTQQAELYTQDFEDFSGTATDGCNCLPSCTSLEYTAETSQVDFHWPKVFEAFKVNFSEFPGVAMTRVTFFFKEQQFTTTERLELYNVVDFLGNCGGLLALFFGLSFLSLVEIIYFLSLRLIINIQNHGRDYWAGSAILINDNNYKNVN